MENKLLIITSGSSGWERSGFNADNREKLSNIFNAHTKEYANVTVRFIFDNSDVQEINTIITDENLQPDFIALHQSVYEKVEDRKILEADNRIVKLFHHENDDKNFYKVILGKVLENSLTLEDVEGFFKPQLGIALNLLHEIYNGKKLSEIEDIEEYKKLKSYEELQKELSNCEFKYDNKTHIQALSDFRDEILKLTLAN